MPRSAISRSIGPSSVNITATRPAGMADTNRSVANPAPEGDAECVRKTDTRTGCAKTLTPGSVTHIRPA
ncbi:hypothetical protein GCM10010198_51360 [Nocardia seriolae]